MTSEEETQRQDDPQDPPPRITFWTVVMSTLAAVVGVQSRKNRERDFQHGSPGAFITAGIIFTVMLVLALVLLVRWVIG